MPEKLTLKGLLNRFKEMKQSKQVSATYVESAPADVRGKSVYRRVLSYLRPHKKQFVLALLCMVVFGASEGGIPFLIKHMLDGVFADQNRSLLYVLPVVLVLFAIFRAAFDFGQQFLMARVGHRIIQDLRNDLNKHILKLSPAYFLQNSSANIIARITSDVMLVKTILTDSVSAVIRDSIRIIALLSAAIYLDPVLALVAFVVFPIGIFPVVKFGRKMRRLSKTGQEAIGTLSGMLQESILGNKVVKVFRREAFEKKRFQTENERLTRTFVKSEKVRAITGPLNEVLASFAVAGIILYGGYSVIGGFRSQGDFIAFLASVFLLYDPFKKLSRVHNTIQQGISGAERIFEVLDTTPGVNEPETPLPLGSTNTIEFKNVSYSYKGDDEQALRDVSLKVPQGSKVALVGFSGSGKSTLVDLIPRFMDPQKGEVTIGGRDIAKCSLAELRDRIAMVDQHTFLFHDTIANNIAYGRQDASRDEIIDAAKAAYAYDFIMQLPDGFDTVVGESGLTLSGGERQRIAIARAILKKAQILILDEATAALDNRSEREVQAALEVLAEGRTSVVIAHRLSTVRDADLIVVLKEGRIVERGTHVDLLDKEGEYAKLYALQFAGEQHEAEADEAPIN